MAFKVTRGGFDGNFRSGPGGDFTTKHKFCSKPFSGRVQIHRPTLAQTRGPALAISIGAIKVDEYIIPLQRPDDDGYLTFREATNWYRNGNGQELHVDLGKINLQGITAADFGHKVGGKPVQFNLLFRLSGFNHSINDGLIYGTISLIYLGNNRVEAGGKNKFDIYDFDIKSWHDSKNKARKTWDNVKKPSSTKWDRIKHEAQQKFEHAKFEARNVETAIGGWVAGEGKGFKIHFKGEGKIGNP